MTTATSSDPRRRHYGAFYRVPDLPTPTGPVGIVMGNCQAESLRIALGSEAADFVRIPPVHELTADDLPYLDHWLSRTEVLVSQPIADDYHGLPLGSGQLAARLPAHATTLLFPVIRFAGLYPFHVIVRPPADPSLSPPLVAYHDLRLLAEASDGRPRRRAATAVEVHAIATESIRQLKMREERHETVPVSDLFAAPAFELMRTLNHPGNPVWLELAGRILDRLGVDTGGVDPGRPLLDSVHAPREPEVLDAWGLVGEATDFWIVAGERIPTDVVRETHLAWYREHPEVIPAGLARHAVAARTLGLDA